MLKGGPAATASRVLGSKNYSSIASPYMNGWIDLNFNGPNVAAGRHRLVGGGSTVFNTKTGGTIGLLSTTFNGLPVVGFSAIVYENGTLKPLVPFNETFNHPHDVYVDRAGAIYVAQWNSNRSYPRKLEPVKR